jgi:dihydrolipoamide dehydrogenase
MSETMETQLAVIGAGPGGYAAAFHAAELGLEVALINAEAKPGGVCLHRGCIPSKALLHVARVLGEAKEAASFGVDFGEPRIDIERLRAWKDRVVDRLAGGIEELCRARKVELIEARASFIDAQTLALERPAGREGARRLRFERAIIATGSAPARPAAFDIGDRRVMDSTGALDLESVPRRLLIVGGGYIGLEMGTVYGALGSRVTVVELTEGLLPGVDRDLVRPLEKRLRSAFEAIYLKTRVTGLSAGKKGIAVRLEGDGAPAEEVVEQVLVSVGRRPSSAGLGLENTAVKVDERGFIEVDRRMQTAEESILAIGDVAGEPMLAHKASREGKVAAEVAAGKASAFDNVAIPAVVFTDPEIAWCGLSETQAARERREVEVARFPWAASGRAATLERQEGLTKLIIDPESERVLGVGITGVGAGELIAEGALAVEMAAVVHDVAGTIHAHPTLSETVGESAEAFLGLATHLYRPRR